MITQRTAPLVHYLRAHRPDTPILLVSGTPYRKTWLTTGLGDGGKNPPAIVDAANGRAAAALAAEYKKLVAAGVTGLSYLAGSTLFDTKDSRGGEAWDDPTYNSVHANDLGHTLMAQRYREVLPPILAGLTAGAEDAEAELAAAARIAMRQTQQQDKLDEEEGEEEQAPPPPPPLQFEWTAMDSPVVDIVGRAFDDTPTPFSRLPTSAKPDVRLEVWNTSLCSAGVALRFSTNASKISLQYSTLWTYLPAGGPNQPWIALGDTQHWAMSG